MKQYRWLMIFALLLTQSVFSAPPKSSNAPAPQALGSTIVVEQNSAMGVTLMPWKEEFATGLDQAPSLYRAPTSPINSNSLQRQTEYRDNLSSYRRSHSQFTP
ncbi:hypothetical protein [Stenotrophobium rhamnosiphilum]|uniref:Uncharacterized protein n=1 Tax=Stenotrophobium rhamnosiphilum TaxID=2029166 RepID=A0A2T5MED3_9GAMM|nr:hypothetical protein [Stenotrophobium rhamnosiphilum]PTU30938.1 hypothetical protein CJD38_11545 [Stenotrophobium rhamnosiphilum]